MASVLLGLTAGVSPAQPYTWDPGQTASTGGGGAGSWNLTAPFWYDGTNDVLWSNTATSVAAFGGTGGMVTVDAAIQANGLTFGTTGYTIAPGTGTLTLAGTTPTVTVTNATDTATISAVIAGSAGLTKAGTGTLVLSGANILTGAVAVQSGALQLAGGDNRLPAASALVLGNSTTSGKLILGDVTGASNQTLTSLTVAGTGTANAVVGGFTTVSTLTLNVPTGTSTYAGFLGGTGPNENNLALTKTGAGTLALGAANTYSGLTTVSAGTLALTNAANAVTGKYLISGSTAVVTTVTDLSFGTAPAASTADAITLNNGGTLQSAASAASTVSVNRGITVGSGGGVILNPTANEYRIHSKITGPGQLTFTDNGSQNIVIDNGTGLAGVSANDYAGGTVINGTGGGGVIPVQGSAGTPNNPTSGPFGTGTITFAGGNFRASGSGGANYTLYNRLTFSANTTVLSGGVATTFAGDATLAGGTRTITNNSANAVTFSGAVGDAGNNFGLTVAGSGTTVLGGTNTFTGALTLNAGTTAISADANLGATAAPLVFNGGTLQVNGTAYSAFPVTRTVAYTGAAGFNIAAAANTFTLGYSGTFGGALTKTGPGALTLSGTPTTAAAVTVSAGTLNLAGTLTTTSNVTVGAAGVLNLTGNLNGSATATTLSYGAAAGNASVNVSGGSTTAFATTGGNVSGGTGVYNQSGGTVTVTPGTGNSQFVAKAAGSYGYFNLTGGTYKNTGRFDVNGANNLGAGLFSTGVVFVGGTNALLDNTNGDWFINGYSLGQVTVAAGGGIDRTGSANPFGVFMDTTVAGGANGTINLAGGTINNGLLALRFGNSTTAANDTGNSGIVNLAGGVLSTGANAATSLPTAPATPNAIYYNFAGGTLRANAALTAPFPVTVSGSFVTTATVYGPVNNSALAGAPSFAGGATIDTNGFAVTVGVPLAGATGYQVTQSNIAIPTTGNTGYVGAPAVTFSKPAAGGVPASGYALIAGGSVTGIVITNPGTYALNETPTITLSGGGGTIAAFTTTALTTANTAGGLTKTGLGPLTLAAANTYAGPTTANGGTLALDFSAATAPATNIIAPTSPLTLSNANLTVTGKASAANSQAFASTALTAGFLSVAANANATANPLALNLGAITRSPGVYVDFALPTGTQSATNGILTSTANDATGILGTWATIQGALAANGGGNIVPFAGYTDIATLGAVVTDGSTHVRINATGTGATDTISAPVTTVSTLTLNTTAATVDTSAGVLRFVDNGGLFTTAAAGALTIGTTAGSGTVTAGGTDNNPGTLLLDTVSTAALTINSVVANNGTGAVAVFKLGTGTAILAADNTYAGGTTVNVGTLQVGNGGTTGSVPGAVVDNGALALNRSDAFTFANNISGTGAVVKNLTNAATLGGTLTYTGATVLNAGTLAFATAPTLAGALTFGATNTTTTLGALDLTATDAAFGGLIVQYNSATGSTQTIPAGRTLAIAGNVVIGSGAGANTTTAFTATGAGKFVMTSPGGTFTVGGTSGTGGVGNVANADFSGLAEMAVNLGGGTLTVSPNITTGTTNVANKQAVLRLAGTSTITAGTIAVGNGPTFNSSATQVNQLRLGSGPNAINANTIAVGNGPRDLGAIIFNGVTGTVVVRNQAGTGPATLGVGSAGGGTATGAAGAASSFDTTGHTADLLFGSTAVGTQGRLGNTIAYTLGFDKGTLTMADLTFGTRLASGTLTANLVSTTNINLGTAASTAADTATITNGILNMGALTQAAGAFSTTLAANLNVAGGTVNIGATSGTAINMISAVALPAAGTSTAPTVNSTTAAVNIAGGTVNLSGSIVRTGVSATGASFNSVTATATLSLTGGTLNMNGKNIGASNALALDTITFTGGTLTNPGTIYTAVNQNGPATVLNVSANNAAVSGVAYTLTSGTVNLADTRTLTVGSAVVNGTTPTLGIGFGSTATSSGQLVTAGTVNLSAITTTNKLNVPLTAVGQLVDQQTYTLTIINAPTTGTQITYGGGAFDANQFNVTATNFATTSGFAVTGTGNIVQISFTAAVPEPMAVGLVAAAGLGLGGLVRRRRTNG